MTAAFLQRVSPKSRGERGGYCWPCMIKSLRLDARFVTVALAPRATVRAVRMADFPEPLCPMMKLICSPRLISRRL
jgi:hypothetical protein